MAYIFTTESNVAASMFSSSSDKSSLLKSGCRELDVDAGQKSPSFSVVAESDEVRDNILLRCRGDVG